MYENLYTFKVKGKDNKFYYPMKKLWNKKDAYPGVGLLDFEWTNDISKALKWNNKEVVEDIAFEFIDSQVIKL